MGNDDIGGPPGTDADQDILTCFVVGKTQSVRYNQRGADPIDISVRMAELPAALKAILGS